MILYFDNFANYVLQWCELRADSFKNYFPLKGGWEAWTQADFAAYLLSQDSTYDVLREQYIFNAAGQKVDWLFNDAATGSVIQKIAIELKCQSFENRDNFATGLQNDIDKIAQNKLKPAYMGCQTGAMGIYFEEQARTWILNNQFVEVFNNGQIGCAIRKLH